MTDLVVGSGFASSVRVQIEEILYKYHILDWWHRREFENLFRAIYYCYITAGVLHARSTPHRCAIRTCICGILDMVCISYIRSSGRQLAGAMLFGRTLDRHEVTSPHNIGPTSDEP